MSTSPSSGPRGTSARPRPYRDASALIPRQRPPSEPAGAARRPLPPARPSVGMWTGGRWSPWFVAGSVVLCAAFVGVGLVLTAGIPGAGGLTVAEMSAPRALALGPPATQAPPVPTASAPAQPPGPMPIPPVAVRVRYELDGPPFAGMISYTSGQESPVTEVVGVRLPWRKEFDATGGFVPSISAQGIGPGPVSCRIMLDGELVSAVTTQGTNAVATCTAQALVSAG